MSELDRLNGMPAADFISDYGGIYEHSPWVAEITANERPFSSLVELAGAMRRAVEGAGPERRIDLIQAHPDLAGKLAKAGKLTAESTREQAGLGLDRLSDEDYESFSSLNSAYREKFGFPFIICARRHTKDSVLAAFRDRLQNERPAEIAEALRQIHFIAELRLRDRLGMA